jgi:hypothetical protein
MNVNQTEYLGRDVVQTIPLERLILAIGTYGLPFHVTGGFPNALSVSVAFRI